MVQDFLTWLEARHVGLRPSLDDNDNGMLSVEQKMGDFVYLGVHDIFDLYTKKDSYFYHRMPWLSYGPSKEKGRIDISGKSFPINDISWKRFNREFQATVTINTPKIPKHYRYSRLDQDAEGNVVIPTRWLKNVTFMLPNGQQLSDRKLWLLIQDDVPYQAGLYQAILRMEHKAGSDQNPQQSDVSDQDIKAIQQIFDKPKDRFTLPQPPVSQKTSGSMGLGGRIAAMKDQSNMGFMPTPKRDYSNARELGQQLGLTSRRKAPDPEVAEIKRRLGMTG